MKTIATLVFLIASAVYVNAAIITHSHCPNHTRNNSENMHTHDTTDPDHNAKHISGHPHTYEFDELCPKGTERDTSMKSGQLYAQPVNPTDNEIFESTDGDEGEEQTRRAPTYDISLPCPKLTGYAIAFNDKDQIKIIGQARPGYLFLHYDTEPITFYAALIGYQHPKSLTLAQWNTWLDIEDIAVVDYRQAHVQCRMCKDKFLNDAERMVLRVISSHNLCYVAEYPAPVPAAPSKRRKLTTTWASLKATHE